MLTTRSLNSLDRIQALNRAFDQALAPLAVPLAAHRGGRAWVPAMDVAEHRDAYIVHAELPGVSPDAVDIQFEQNVLTIRGTKPAALDMQNEGEVRVFAAERVHGSFERAVRLPEFVDGDRIEATFTNGLLTVTVPKAQTARARKIEVKA